MQGKRPPQQLELVIEEPRTPDTRTRRLLRAIDALIDWSPARKLSADSFAKTGRPSIDPVVMVKMMLVGYLFGIPSDRRVVEECADRLSFREFLGYGRHESLPTHASFTHWRQRLGSEFFRALLHDIVRQCVEHGMAVSTVRTVDGTSVKAQADEDGPIVQVPVGQDPDVFLESFFPGAMAPKPLGASGPLGESNASSEVSEPEESRGSEEPGTSGPLGESNASSEVSEPEESRGSEEPATAADAGQGAASSARGSAREAASSKWKSKAPKMTPINLHDPEARMQRKTGEVAAFRYHASFCADAATGLITDATAAALESAETALDHVRHDPVAVRELVADALYDDGETLAALQWLGVRTYVPERRRNGTGLLEPKAFIYHAKADEYVCPEGKRLRHYRYDEEKRLHFYIARASDCGACPRKAECTRAKRRTVTRTLHAAGLQRCVRGGLRYGVLMRCRRINEHLNRVAKRDHALTHARGLGVKAMCIQAALTAMAIDLKKLVQGVTKARGSHALACAAKRPTYASESALSAPTTAFPGPRAPRTTLACLLALLCHPNAPVRPIHHALPATMHC